MICEKKVIRKKEAKLLRRQKTINKTKMKLEKYNSENFVEKALILNFTKIDNL